MFGLPEPYRSRLLCRPFPIVLRASDRSCTRDIQITNLTLCCLSYTSVPYISYHLLKYEASPTRMATEITRPGTPRASSPINEKMTRAIINKNPIPARSPNSGIFYSSFVESDRRLIRPSRKRASTFPSLSYVTRINIPWIALWMIESGAFNSRNFWSRAAER